MTAPESTIAVMMGVSGSGKTTVGKALARTLGWAFKEGDDLHPAANIAKMKSGAPLTDADRAPWLARVEAWISGELGQHRSGVIACVRLVFLEGDRDLIAHRLAHRRGHFMPPALLASQFEALQAPASDEHPILIDIAQPLDAQVAEAAARLRGDGDADPAGAR